MNPYRELLEVLSVAKHKRRGGGSSDSVRKSNLPGRIAKRNSFYFLSSRHGSAAPTMTTYAYTHSGALYLKIDGYTSRAEDETFRHTLQGGRDGAVAEHDRITMSTLLLSSLQLAVPRYTRTLIVHQHYCPLKYKSWLLRRFMSGEFVICGKRSSADSTWRQRYNRFSDHPVWRRWQRKGRAGDSGGGGGGCGEGPAPPPVHQCAQVQPHPSVSGDRARHTQQQHERYEHPAAVVNDRVLYGGGRVR
ncbi:hypothetical protein QTP88_009751 [Uroleucon formosanum]